MGVPGCMAAPTTHADGDSLPSDLFPAALHAWQAWQEGGFSDDLTLAAKCRGQGLHVWCPAFALFPQWYGPGLPDVGPDHVLKLSWQDAGAPD